ncbi:GDP-mannose 4,6-dehydratase [Klebsiella pneumoniae]|uniref:GDP-mannose 4,6-dehydratase n=1 Tax=Klebsiella pneumoniae TaxID=573 RepID=UPI00388E7C30
MAPAALLQPGRRPPVGRHGGRPAGDPEQPDALHRPVAVGRRESLAVFGNDYPTEDGTGVRDYIHVMDLADGHVAAMEKLADKAGVHIYNLGAGVGSSVLDVVNAFSKACGKPINYHFAPRRDGDLPAYWADAAKADRELNWRVTRNWTKWRRTPALAVPSSAGLSRLRNLHERI